MSHLRKHIPKHQFNSYCKDKFIFSMHLWKHICSSFTSEKAHWKASFQLIMQGQVHILHAFVEIYLLQCHIFGSTLQSISSTHIHSNSVTGDQKPQENVRDGCTLPPSRKTVGQKVNRKKLAEKGGTPPPLKESGLNLFC